MHGCSGCWGIEWSAGSNSPGMTMTEQLSTKLSRKLSNLCVATRDSRAFAVGWCFVVSYTLSVRVSTVALMLFPATITCITVASSLWAFGTPAKPPIHSLSRSRLMHSALVAISRPETSKSFPLSAPDISALEIFGQHPGKHQSSTCFSVNVNVKVNVNVSSTIMLNNCSLVPRKLHLQFHFPERHRRVLWLILCYSDDCPAV